MVFGQFGDGSCGPVTIYLTRFNTTLTFYSGHKKQVNETAYVHYKPPLAHLSENGHIFRSASAASIIVELMVLDENYRVFAGS